MLVVQTLGEGEAFFQIFQTIRFAADGTRERERERKRKRQREANEGRSWERSFGRSEKRGLRGAAIPRDTRVEMEVQVFFLRRNTLLLLVPPLVMENPPTIQRN